MTDRAAASRTNGKAPRGVIVKPSRRLDSYRTYVTNDPTPDKIASLFRRIDQGEIDVLVMLQQEMEAKCAQLRGVAETRRNALTALEWCIEPEEETEDDALAVEVADYLNERLRSIRSWPDALEHLSSAIGPNVAVVETVWDKFELVDFVPVPGHRLTLDPILNMHIAIVTDEVLLGIPVDDPRLLNKFIVYHRNLNGGFPFRSTLTHATAWLYLMDHFSRVDWMAFSELYGQPWRMAFYDDTTIPEDRTTTKDMLDSMGSDTSALLPKGIKPELFQATGTGETYEKQLGYADNKFAILYLGQTLTTEIKDGGSRAAAQVHDKVRRDILAGDIQAEARAVREQVLRPMVELRFPGRDISIPRFIRKVYEPRDVESERLTLEQLQFAAQQGLPVESDWLYSSLGIPRPPTNGPPEVIRLGRQEDSKAPDAEAPDESEQETADAAT